VLLAQGDFAAFLKANTKSRSELLERITGTEIYTRLSIAAHQREGREKLKLSTLEERLGAARPLGDEARKTLEAVATEERTRTCDAESRLEEARRIQGWHRRVERANAAVAEGESALSATKAAWDTAGPRREYLKNVRSVEDARSALEAVDRTQVALTEAARAVKCSEEALTQTEAQVASHRATADAAVDAADAAARTVDEQASEISAARAADGDLVRLHSKLEHARLDYSAAAKLSTDALSSLSRLEAEEAATRQQADEHRKWLANHQDQQKLGETSMRWDGDLTDAIIAAAESADAARRVEASEAQHRGITERLELLTTRLAESQKTEHTLRGKLQSLHLELDEHNLDNLAAVRESLENRREALRAAKSVADELRRRTERTAGLVAEAQRLLKEATQAKKQAADVEHRLGEERAAMTEAERSLERAVVRNAAGVEQLRQRLEDGRPCPVCGSTDHPWSESATPMEGFETEQRERTEALRASVESLTAELDRLRTDRRKALQGASERDRDSASEAETVTELGRQLATHAATCDLHLGDNPERILGEHLDRIDNELQTARKTEGAHRRLAAHHKDLRTRLDQKTAAREACQNELRQVEEESKATAIELATTTAQATAASARVAGTEERLVDVLEVVPGWREMLRTDPEELRERCRREAASWNRHNDGLAAANQRLTEGEPRLSELGATSKHHTARADRLVMAENMAEQAVEKAATVRLSLLDGRDADVVENELRETRDRTRSAAESARNQAAEVSLRHAAASAELKDRTHTRDKAVTVAAHARTALDERLVQHGVDEARLRELLAVTAEQIRDETAALEHLRTTVDEANVRLEERRSARDNLRAEQPDDVASVSDTAQAVKTAEDELGEARRSLTETEVALHHDDERRVRSRQLLGELERTTAYWRTWADLKDVVGSADGSRFREFAQSLTLDALTHHANRHLDDLARRFVLQRVPDSDLELQIVDCELANEVRSIHSLSGGESFLVSLALALGLASLSSRQTPVESLFIDEGFGTLDPATLDIALSALDALQAQGRQVGVISHVPAMVDRIGVRVQVTAVAAGQSRVQVVDPFTTV